MDIIVIMMTSGSCMMLFYLSLTRLLGTKLSSAWRYRLLKAVILYYLIPPFVLQKIYEGAAKLFSGKNDSVSGEVFWIVQSKSLIFSDGESIYLNERMWTLILAGSLCCLGALSVMACSFYRYHASRKQLLQCRGNAETEEDKRALEELQKGWKMKRCVRCLKYSNSTTGEKGAFTIGVLKPVIFCTGSESGEARKLILKHEMQHIRGMDVLWKILASCAWALHWYNPLVWWLQGELEIVCEMACDEAVLRDADEETVQRYMTLIIETASAQENPSGRKELWSFALSKNGKKIKRRILNMKRRNQYWKTPASLMVVTLAVLLNSVTVLWSFALSKNGKKIKRRILNMKRRNQYWKTPASLMVVTLAVLLNSVTVLAYEDAQRFTMTNQNGEPVDVEKALQKDFVFYPNTVNLEEVEGIFSEAGKVTIKYDVQFTDENGTIYPMDELQVCATCKHTWIYGTVEDHDKYSDGSCTVTQYEAKRCTKCGTTIKGEVIVEQKYTKCPH